MCLSITLTQAYIIHIIRIHVNTQIVIKQRLLTYHTQDKRNTLVRILFIPLRIVVSELRLVHNMMLVCMLHYVGILGQAKLSGSQPKSLDWMQVQVRYVRDAGIEPESIPTCRALRTRH